MIDLSYSCALKVRVAWESLEGGSTGSIFFMDFIVVFELVCRSMSGFKNSLKKMHGFFLDKKDAREVASFQVGTGFTSVYRESFY